MSDDPHDNKRQRTIVKTNPCEACRDHKRKCSMGVPCDRCRLLGLDCIYIVTKPPDDEEYFQIAANLQARAEFEALQHQMALMEAELGRMKAFGPMRALTCTASENGDCSTSMAGVKIEPDLLEDVKILDTVPKLSHSPSTPGESTFGNGSESGSLSPPGQTCFSSPVSTSSCLAGDLSHISLVSPVVVPDAKDYGFTTKETDQNADPTENADSKPPHLDWSVVIKRDGGLSINTNINQFQDLLTVLAQIVNKTSAPIPSSFLSPSIDRPFGPATWIHKRKNKFVYVREEHLMVMRRAAKNPDSFKAVIPSLSAHFTAMDFVNNLVHSLMELYWNCCNNHNPALHRSTFMSRFYNPRDPLSSPAVAAICAFLTRSKCLHVQSLIPSRLIPQFGEFFFSHARDKIEDTFDQEDLETFIALIYAGQYKYHSMDIKSAFMLQGHAHRLAELLIPAYTIESPTSMHCQPDFLGQREILCRICYTLRGVSKGLRFIMNERRHGQDRCHGKGLNLVERLGYPEPLDDEDPMTRRAVLSSRFFHMHMDSGKDSRQQLRWEDEVPFEVIKRFENRMNAFYENLPPEFRVNLTLFPQTDEGAVRAQLERDQPDRCALSLLTKFYAGWMFVHENFVLGPGEDEEMASGIARRSQAICSRAAEMITLLFDHLTARWPCFPDMMMLLVACDVHVRNTASLDKEQVERAKRMIVLTFRIMRRGYLKRVDKRWLGGLLGEEDEEERKVKEEEEDARWAGWKEGSWGDETKIGNMGAEEALCRKLIRTMKDVGIVL
ncbi:hypothetical protein BC936DRAFT_138178 [Jimgerdemannia flammicorona]|uniref:Zn(2)-C6 fungal-type domain-containing protein n=1 Tax=Jimgerdemannia flammicorona TaxID=994334 RepID=A0A433CVN4_9FUNG|nr:hypothetical protein BC936DRAFT_138178 [Jimgerdemannia flammicorona]